jgi:hypothetical protein
VQRTQAPLPHREGRGDASTRIREQAERVWQAEDTWRMCDPGTHAEAAAWHWLQRQREILRQMLIDERAAGRDVATVARRITWQSFWQSRAADLLLCVVFGGLLAATLAVVILLLDGGWR